MVDYFRVLGMFTNYFNNNRPPRRYGVKKMIEISLSSATIFLICVCVSIFSIGYAFGQSAGFKDCEKKYYNDDFLK